MREKSPFTVRFWGVRGSIACPGPRTARYGGNTSSLEVRCGEELLLLDVGTGIRYLGRALEGTRIDADIYFPHTHFDPLWALPFFRPLFEPQNRFRLWAGHLRGAMTLKRVLAEFMVSPLFPVPPEVFRSNLEYRDFTAGETLSTPKGEHVPGSLDRNVLALINGAELVIYDAMYTDDEYRRYVGWGPSTWQEGIRLCREAGAKRMVVFHHDPDHDDEMLDGIAREVERALPGSVV